jgi:hypothetical protein
MTTAVEIIRNFYAALRSGDTTRALGLMSDDIEWITMWQYKAVGRGPDKVAEGVLMPLMSRSSSFPPNSSSTATVSYRLAVLSEFTALPARQPMRDTPMYGRSPTAGSHAFASTSTRSPSPRRGDSSLK